MTTKNPNFSENMLSVEEARENILNMMFVLNTEYWQMQFRILVDRKF